MFPKTFTVWKKRVIKQKDNLIMLQALFTHPMSGRVQHHIAEITNVDIKGLKGFSLW